MRLAPIFLVFPLILGNAGSIHAAGASAEPVEALLETAERQLAGGDYRGTLKSVKRILREDPDHVAARILGGTAEFERGRLDRSRQLLVEALELDPALESLEVHYRLGVIAVTRAGERKHRADAGRLLDEAVLRFDRALAAEPGHRASLARRATALLDLGRTDDAIEAHERWLTAEPGAESARIALVRLQFESDDRDGVLDAMSGSANPLPFVELVDELIRADKRRLRFDCPIVRRTLEMQESERADRGIAAAASYDDDPRFLAGYLTREPPYSELNLVLALTMCEVLLRGSSRKFTLPDRTGYVRPVYPEAARVERKSGSVRLMTSIRTDGTTGAITLLSHPRAQLGYDFEYAAQEAVGQWRYDPATRDGIPVEIPMIVVVDFWLQ